jgi:hypothetical protein
VLLLRLPHPPGFSFAQHVVEVEPDMVDGAIIIDMPRGYGLLPKPSPGANVVPAARVGRPEAVGVIGEPEPGRSALDRRRT